MIKEIISKIQYVSAPISRKFELFKHIPIKKMDWGELRNMINDIETPDEIITESSNLAPRSSQMSDPILPSEIRHPQEYVYTNYGRYYNILRW